MDKPASELRRGDRVWIGGKGWRALSRVRHITADWIGEGRGPAIELRWRCGSQTAFQHVKPEARIAIQAEG